MLCGVIRWPLSDPLRSSCQAPAPARHYASAFLPRLPSAGRLDAAEESLRDADQLNTYTASSTREWRAGMGVYLAILRGDAAAALGRTDAMEPGRWRERWRALALQIGADRMAADAALRHLVEADAQTKSDAYTIARVHALRGDADRAFEWLQRDLDRGGSAVNHVLSDSLLLRFRDDPRFAAWCKRTGLPSPQASDALGLDAIRASLARR